MVNFIKSKKGLSLLELMVAMSIMGVVAYIGSSILQNVTKEGIYAERRSQVAQIVTEITRASNIFVARVVPNGFDPIYTGNFSNSRIGTAWYSDANASTDVSSADMGKWVSKYNSLSLSQTLKDDPTVSSKYACASITPSATPFQSAGATCFSLNSCVYNSTPSGLNFNEAVLRCEKSGSALTVPLLAIDKFNGAQRSHDLVLTSLIFKKSDGSTTIQNTGAYLSRCVPAADLSKVDTDYQQYDKIDKLKRPFIANASGSVTTSTVATSTENQTVKTYVAPDLRCCDLGKDLTQDLMSNCESISNNGTALYYPTVFLYRGENKVSAIPNVASRSLVPGLAMVLRFDSAANPQSFDLSVLQIENACMTGRRRAFWPCDSNPSNNLAPKDGEFNNQTEIKVIVKGGAPTTGASGSGIIKLGTRAVFESQ